MELIKKGAFLHQKQGYNITMSPMDSQKKQKINRKREKNC
jgi:hypothetical protein